MTFGVLACLIAAGLAGPALSAFAPQRIPVGVGEIAAGVVLGATGFGIIHPGEPTVAFLSRLGFAMLMFVTGTHVPLRDARLRRALGRGTAAALLVGVLAVPAGIVLARLAGLGHPALLMLLLASSSAAYAGPVLDAAPTTPATLVALAWITVANVATVMLLPLALAPDRLLRALAGGVVVTASAVALWWLGGRAAAFAAVDAARARSRQQEWALDLRLSLLALALLAYVADRSSTSILVAGFAAGLVVGAIGEPKRLTRQVRGLANGFLMPAFFVVLGAQIDLRALERTPRYALLAVALAVVAALLHAAAGLAVRQPAGVGLVAAGSLGVPAAIADAGLGAGFLNAGEAAAIVCAALGTLVVATVGASLLAPRGVVPERRHKPGPRAPLPPGSESL